MLQKLTRWLLLFAAVWLVHLGVYAQKSDKWSEFFADSHERGIDYIFRLFEDADIVILGERDHRDMTQYDFIRDLISDPRFVEIGNVYTEVGCTNHTHEVNELIGKDLPDSLFRPALLQYLFNEDYYPLWEKTNRSVFLTDLHNVNKTLPENQCIYLGLTDLTFDWNSIHTHDEWIKYTEEINRDTVMFQNFIRLFESQHKPKALLITNAPHAMLGREGGLIRERYGDRVKTVLLNWSIWWGDKTGPYEEGRVDTAYKLAGSPSVGFDVKGTPFAELPMVDSIVGIHADGMVWHAAYYDWVGCIGIEGILDSDESIRELYRRESIVNGDESDNRWSPDDLRNYYGRQRIIECK